MPRKKKAQTELEGMPEPLKVWPDTIGGREVEDLGLRFGGVVSVSHNELGQRLGEFTAPHGNRLRLVIDVVAVGHADKVAVKAGQNRRLTVISSLQVESIIEATFLASADALDAVPEESDDPPILRMDDVELDEMPDPETAARAARVLAGDEEDSE